MDRKHYKYDKIHEKEIPKIILAAPSTENLDHLNDNNQIEDITPKPMRRRNSISMPNLDDLKVFIENETDDESKKNLVDVNTIEEEDDEFQHISNNLQRVRRKSVLSSTMLKPPIEEDLSPNSPTNSITSVNSIASLLKEKFQNIPQTIRRKKSPEYKTKVFVGLLFTTIVVLISTAYILYHQKVLAKVYFGNMKFNKDTRTLKIFNEEGEDIVKLTLGTTIDYDIVLNCLPKDSREDGSLCLEWMNRARLYMSFYNLGSDVKCYNLQWVSLSDNLAPTDCFDMSNAHWYGGGQTAESAWPLEKGSHFYQPFITGNIETHEWGNVLKRYFINSKGVAIIIDNETPLYISIKDSPKEFCLRAQYDNFAFVNKFTSTAQLNYSMCTSTNMSQLHVFLSEHTLWDGLKKEDSNIIDYFLTEPVWEMPEMKEVLTEVLIDSVTTEIANFVGTLKQGHILFNEFWQNQIGDFELDEKRFTNFSNFMTKQSRRGFRVVFTIQPFISTESFNFAKAVEENLLISERFSDRRIPALTRYKNVQSAGVLDITNPRTVNWLLDKLNNIIQTHKIDSFYLDMGTAYNMPLYYSCQKGLLNPDEYKTIFTNSLQGKVSLFGVSSAIERPRSPSFVVLPEFEFSWTGLRNVVPTILTYGILGFPFLIPGAVGGDYATTQDVVIVNGTEHIVLEDPELYIRWLQLATFLPVVRYKHLPSSYSQKNISSLAKDLAKKRYDYITPKLKKFARVSLNLGLPIIRPLWMLDSDDPNCHLAADEFSIGDEIIVAPILYSGAREREIYLPAGVWKDGIDGSLRKGNRWIHDYRVEDNVAYFERMPDDTRF
ncbi:myogenesis-regulating glycosidase [Diorhabda carinulata]|uniref:myogenesis-regulating glycosidase n=1 Tax=Diorhabda carinulata TaxID=1163345 RepID=UPI0025A09BB7|nr:myogenesis-regulating glycosidase [Diorhabda carinulata]XP_057651255.1 myogenesis-regulating glycosidase [Diorhabda carinulata]XP_057651256.1 myogenesis-regulating glycosidase [Diorhabda carinulata]XP_057651257.1 myogenesis-regulating glycosidase [Diorhabda carinulata]